MGARESKARPLSVSCSVAEWEQVRARARRDGLTVSEYVRRRLRQHASADTNGRVGNSPSVALPSDTEWRQLLADVEKLTALPGAHRDDRETIDVTPGGALAMLVWARLDEMARWGRERPLGAVLRDVVGETRGDAIRRTVTARAAGRDGGEDQPPLGTPPPPGSGPPGDVHPGPAG